MHSNLAKQRLKEGRLALGLGLRQARTVDIASAAATCGFDWLFIDMEHNAMSVDTAAQIAAAAPGMGVTPIVRVPGHEHYHATRLLDNGAQGIVAPHVDDAAQARRIAEACLYPPLGRRSIPGLQPQLAFKPIAPAEATRLVNEQILVVVMLESPRAIENAEEIAAVPGVDVLLIGTSDLCAEIASSARSATRASRPPIAASSTPAAGTASTRAWAACTIRRTWKSMSAWACASS